MLFTEDFKRDFLLNKDRIYKHILSCFSIYGNNNSLVEDFNVIKYIEYAIKNSHDMISDKSYDLYQFIKWYSSNEICEVYDLKNVL